MGFHKKTFSINHKKNCNCFICKAENDRLQRIAYDEAKDKYYEHMMKQSKKDSQNETAV